MVVRNMNKQDIDSFKKSQEFINTIRNYVNIVIHESERDVFRAQRVVDEIEYLSDELFKLGRVLRNYGKGVKVVYENKTVVERIQPKEKR